MQPKQALMAKIQQMYVFCSTLIAMFDGHFEFDDFEIIWSSISTFQHNISNENPHVKLKKESSYTKILPKNVFCSTLLRLVGGHFEIFGFKNKD